MNTKIDIKSALLGLTLGILAMIAVGAASSAGPVGRYQVSGTGSHGLILDTATGRVWSAYLASGSGRTDPDFYQPKIDEKK